MREKTLKTMSERLKAYLTVRRLSYREVAERAGISRGTLIRMIHGTGNPHAEHAFAVAQALDCEVSDLVR